MSSGKARNCEASRDLALAAHWFRLAGAKAVGLDKVLNLLCSNLCQDAALLEPPCDRCCTGCRAI